MYSDKIRVENLRKKCTLDQIFMKSLEIVWNRSETNLKNFQIAKLLSYFNKKTKKLFILICITKITQK